MFFKKQLSGKKTATKQSLGQFIGGTDSVTDELFLTQNVSRVSYNATGVTGALKHKYGFCAMKHGDCELKLPFSVQKVWFLSNNDINHYVAFCIDRLYFFDCDNMEKGWQPVPNSVFTTTPSAVRYKLLDNFVLYIASSTDGLFQYDGQLMQIEDAPSLTSMAIHYERLFGVSGCDSVLYFSDDMSPSNWNISIDEAGYIELADEKGSILTVLSFSDYLFLFRENGITRVSAYASQTDYSVSQMYVTSGKIFGDTVTICGDRIMFLSQDGLFSFSGTDTKKMLHNMDGLLTDVDNTNAVATYARGKYFLACKMDFCDNEKIGCENHEYTNNALLIFDFNTGEQTIMRGVDIVFLGRDQEKNLPIMCFGGTQSNTVGTITNSGSFFEESLDKCWRCPTTDFGYSYSTKVLKEIVLYTKYDIDIEVETEKEVSVFSVSGSDTAQKVKIGVGGELFTISYKTNYKEMQIMQPKLVYSVVGN